LPGSLGIRRRRSAHQDGILQVERLDQRCECAKVKQGSFLVGVGGKFDFKKTMAMAVGATGTAPAGLHHYSAAKGQQSSP
jgi:hypothetical protein